jgi:hypothetical protein
LKTRAARFIIAQLALCLLLLWIWPRLELEDSYIFLTYARNLAHTGAFTFNPGVVSYGFSSPMYVLVLAAASKVTGIPVGVALSNLLGVLFCALSAGLVWLLWETLGQVPPAGDLPLTAVLLSGPWFFTVWFLFGMESGLAVLALLGLLLWLARLRTGAARLPWLLLGIVSACVLATTRLESAIFIASCLVVAAATRGSSTGHSTAQRLVQIAAVGLCSAAAELAWLLYAHHAFGTYMPWTSTARLLYYLPGRFGLDFAAQFYALGPAGRAVVAAKAAVYMLLGGPMKVLLLAFPLAAAVVYLRSPRQDAAWQWMLRLAVLGMALQVLCFACLFPLAQNRHFAPYIAGLWVLVAPGLVRTVHGWPRPAQLGTLAAVLLLWAAGSVQYRRAGQGLQPLYRIAAAGILKPGDAICAEPIGVLSFMTPARIADLGGLTDKDSWPLLMRGGQGDLGAVLRWALGKGATHILIRAQQCPPEGQVFGRYCVIDAKTARRMAPPQAMLTSPPPAAAASSLVAHSSRPEPAERPAAAQHPLRAGAALHKPLQ